MPVKPSPKRRIIMGDFRHGWRPKDTEASGKGQAEPLPGSRHSVQTEWAQPQGAPFTEVQALLLDPFTEEEGKGKGPGRPNSQLQPSPHKVMSPPSAPFIKHYFRRKSLKVKSWKKKRGKGTLSLAVPLGCHYLALVGVLVSPSAGWRDNPCPAHLTHFPLPEGLRHTQP